MGRETITIQCTTCRNDRVARFGCEKCGGEGDVERTATEVFDLEVAGDEFDTILQARDVRIALLEQQVASLKRENATLTEERDSALAERDESFRDAMYLRTRLAAMGEGMPALIGAVAS